MDNDNDIIQIPYIVHEGSVARMERTIKRLWVLCIVIFLALVVTNAGWIIYESSFADVEIEQDVDTGIGDAVVNGYGDINYGTGEAENSDASQEK